MRVVVTGMGVITPVGQDVETFWKNIVDGNCGISVVDDPLYDQLPSKVWSVVKDFNPAAYGIEPAMIRKQDRFTLIALAASQQAILQSRIKSGENVRPERFGVVFGSGIGGFQTTALETVKMANEGPKWISPQFIPTVITNVPAAYISIRNDARGPSFSISTACSTSTHCIGEAYKTIKHGEADVMVCGGVEAVCTPMALATFGNMKALTKSTDPMRASLPFNSHRGGFVLGEGSGALVLESYEHAKKRGAGIIAEVCGYGCSSDAFHITAPRPDGTTQAEAIRQALKQAGYCGRRDNIYVNAHGTGTLLNDTVETLAFHLAFGRNASRIHVSSTKSVTGHLMGGTGAVEAIAAILALNRGVIPPTIGLDEIDPACDLDYTPNKAKKEALTIAISDSLGFGGHNSCLAFRKL